MPWKKGQSGNPKGPTPHALPISRLLRTVGNTRTEEGKLRKRALAEKMYEIALKGDVGAARLVYEYCDGKPLQRNEIDLSGGVNLFVAEEIISAEPDGNNAPAPDAGSVPAQ